MLLDGDLVDHNSNSYFYKICKFNLLQESITKSYFRYIRPKIKPLLPISLFGACSPALINMSLQ